MLPGSNGIYKTYTYLKCQNGTFHILLPPSWIVHWPLVLDLHSFQVTLIQDAVTSVNWVKNSQGRGNLSWDWGRSSTFAITLYRFKYRWVQLWIIDCFVNKSAGLCQARTKWRNETKITNLILFSSMGIILGRNKLKKHYLRWPHVVRNWLDRHSVSTGNLFEKVKRILQKNLRQFIPQVWLKVNKV